MLSRVRVIPIEWEEAGGSEIHLGCRTKGVLLLRLERPS
jgi:hypothetical protein